MLFSGALVTVGFRFFFGTENLRAQVLITGSLALLAFVALFAVVEIDHPFSGPTRVSSEALKAVAGRFAL